MTTVEITQVFQISDSTLSDWQSNPKRKNLLTLLRTMNIEEVEAYLCSQKIPPKFSPKTRFIKLRKNWFSIDLLWSRQDRSVIDINSLISVYLLTPNQDDTEALIRLFGIERVRSILMKLKSTIPDEDFQEASEQLEFAMDSKSYYESHPLPSLENLLRHPKKRYIVYLSKHYTAEQLVQMAQEKKVPFNSLFQIKKMAGLSA